MPLPYQPENNGIPVKTPPTGFDALRTLAVIRARRIDPFNGLRYFEAMNFGVLFEKVTDKDFPTGYFYAHVPSLGLTTHGEGIEGARQAAADLLRLWIAEKHANGEAIPQTGETLFSTLELPDHALQGA